VLSHGTNLSQTLNETDLLLCGSAFCPAQIVEAVEVEDEEEEDMVEVANSTTNSLAELENFKTDEERIYVLAGIYLGCSICAALIIAFFVDPISR
jgi:hypothetical protein